VVGLSAPGAHKDVQAALEAGAVACVLKSADPEDIATAVRQVLDQSVFLGSPQSPAAGKRLSPGESLTPRERDVLELVAQGRSNAEVARRLWVTEETVKFHLTRIYRKLGVSNRTEAARRAQLNGLLSGDAAPRSSR
jgi:DNA-binding NarL/FixJ family response regulator